MNILRLCVTLTIILSACGETDVGYCPRSRFHGNTTSTCRLPKPRNYVIPRIEPGEVGSVKNITIQSGRTHQMITRARNPPVFEIPDFLSDPECRHIIIQATLAGMEDAEILGDVGSYGSEDTDDLSSIDRLGDTTSLLGDDSPALRAFQRRASRLTGIPLDMIRESEGIQIGHYGQHGHYHAHFDSSPDWSESEPVHKPCCLHHSGLQGMNYCHVCRYITVMVYLNDVEEGGETAFPAADREPAWELEDEDDNLSLNCHRASLVVKPKRGTAMFWYNNFRDEKNGWLGEADPNSVHGGCDVIRGHKWIANQWINIPRYEHKDRVSVYRDRWS